MAHPGSLGFTVEQTMGQTTLGPAAERQQDGERGACRPALGRKATLRVAGGEPSLSLQAPRGVGHNWRTPQLPSRLGWARV